MELFETEGTFLTWRKNVSSQIGFVPTMGALHEGHASLLRRARRECDKVVLSIFVNPTQFGPNEDFNKYPRTLEQDCIVAKECGIDVVFAPAQFYSADFSTYIEETKRSIHLCGKFRPGHFRGVTTVVYKLLRLVDPHFAYFGLKDAQQFFVIKKMVEDLNLSTTLVGCDTVRESDGLAMSSRNRYLTKEERLRAPLLYQTLLSTRIALLEKKTPWKTLQTQATQALTQSSMTPQYFELCSIPDLQPTEALSSGQHILASAVLTENGTRLIDNVIF
ncbi:MAG: pantoate--beta-alanine ligase [Bacteriovoracia bacterium]